jgi:hypothetical protein
MSAMGVAGMDELATGFRHAFLPMTFGVGSKVLP